LALDMDNIAQGTPGPLPQLDKLAVEMTQEIISYLSAPSSAALTLCNKKLASTLCSHFRQECNEVLVERRELVDLLLKDMDGHAYCDYCKKIHEADFEIPGIRRTCASDDALQFFNTNDAYVHINAAMVLYHQGKSPQRHLDFLTSLNTASMRPLGPSISRKPQIRLNRVMLRSRYCFLVPQKYHKHASVRKLLKVHMKIGEQVMIRGQRGRLHHNKELIYCLSWHLAKRSALCLYCRKVRRCTLYNTQFQISVDDKTRDGQGLVLAVTVWADLGLAGSSQPRNEHWENYLECLSVLGDLENPIWASVWDHSSDYLEQIDAVLSTAPAIEEAMTGKSRTWSSLKKKFSRACLKDQTEAD
jgi:hypothetical protein